MPSDSDEHWYKKAIIYELDVETFQDSNEDGVGDFGGLTRRLDYIAGLGATCIWLLPFYPSPNKDNGYDVSDHYGVDPRFGSLGDFVDFERAAKSVGLRVIVDLVVNHTSNQHPWFRSARADPNSPFRDFYFWSKEKRDSPPGEFVLPGKQKSLWTYDDQAEAYYFHRFLASEPDLNTAHPGVVEEIKKIMGFWLELGVSGFRIDAAPDLVALKPGGHYKSDQAYQYFNQFHELLSWRKGEAILLAEADLEADLLKQYFGSGERMHMLFNFIINQRIYLSLVDESAEPLRATLENLPPVPGQWANFLRNHDELTLDKLSSDERKRVMDALAPDENMRIYGRGIRRRLAPMMNGDRRKLEWLHSLLLTLPGTPVLRYGEELGMGDDLSLPDRASVRTPMQWSAERNAGFSSAPEERLVRPVIREGPFDYRKTNVVAQLRDPSSLQSWLQRAIHIRRQYPELSVGGQRLLETSDAAILATYAEAADGSGLVVLHNCSSSDRSVRIDLPDGRDPRLTDIFADHGYPELGTDSGSIPLRGFGYRWLRVAPAN